MKLQEKVKLGAKLLDKKIPGWRKKIDLNDFDMTTCQECVLGQLTEHYALGLGQLGIEGESEEHGFSAAYSEDWGDLQKLWVEEIISQDHIHNQQESLLSITDLLQQN